LDSYIHSGLLPENCAKINEKNPVWFLSNNQEDFSMKRSKFSEQQIAFILRQAEEGVPVGEVCRRVGISEQTYYWWRKRYGGMMPSEMKRLKQLEEENMRLKKLVADLSLDKEMLQEVVRKKL
jgi:putative transposase